MKKILAVSVFIAFVVGCDVQPQPPTADEALQQMHQKQISQFQEELEKTQAPTKFEATTIFEGNVDVKSVGLPVKGTFAMNITQKGDFSDAQNPKTELGAQINVDGEFPAMMTGQSQKFNGNVDMTVRAVDQNVSLNIADVNIVVPQAPMPITVPTEVKDKWYTTTVEEINKLLQQSPGVTVTMDDILVNPKVKYEEMTAEMKKVMQNAQIFTPTSALVVEKDEYVFDVETDNAKIKTFYKSLIDFMLTLQKNPELASMTEEMEQDFNQFMDTEFGKLSGTVRLNQELKLVAFEGIVSDKSGAKLADIKLENRKPNFMLAINPVEDGTLVEYDQAGDEIEKEDEALKFKKTGENYVLNFGGNDVVTGTVSESAFTAQITDPDTDTKMADLNFSKSGDSWSGKINVPDFEAVVDVTEMSYKASNNNKNIDMALKATVNVGGNEVGNLSLTSTQKESSSVSIPAPDNTVPFEQIMEDIPMLNPNFAAGAMMGGGENPTVPDMGPMLPMDDGGMPGGTMSPEEVEAMMKAMQDAGIEAEMDIDMMEDLDMMEGEAEMEMEPEMMETE